MNIIEKLGITDGPWIVAPHGMADRDIEICTDKDKKIRDGKIYQSDWVCDLCADNTDGGIIRTENNALLISTAPEMLEALIEDLLEDERVYQSKRFEHPVDMLGISDDLTEEYNSFKRKLCVVEKATGKTWTEIKELL